MKLNKFFMLGLAGLAFAACSNEDEVGNDLSQIVKLSQLRLKQEDIPQERPETKLGQMVPTIINLQLQ